MKFSIKKIFLGLFAPIILGGSLALSVSCSATNASHFFKKTKAFNKEFTSREQMVEYALKNMKKVNESDGNIYWTLNNGDTKVFTSNLEFRAFIAKRIQTIQMKSTRTEEELNNSPKRSNLSFVDKEIMEILASSQTKDKNQRFYRGINDTIFTEKEKAIESYFQYHKIYNYNGVGFRSLSELKVYLNQNYTSLDSFDRTGKKNLISPSGVSSDFFNLTNLSDREQARNFIGATAEKYVQIKRGDGTFAYVKVADLVSHKATINPIDFSINDVNAFNINSNNGNATWITDSLIEDKAGFYGDYFTKTKTDQITQINNPNKWEKISGNPAVKKAEIANITSLGNFFRTINKMVAISEGNLTLEKRVAIAKIQGIFDVPKYKKYITNMLHRANSWPLNSIVSNLKWISKTMGRGKRYNPLYELPILYQRSITSIEKYGLKNKDIGELGKFFEMVVNDYQDVIDALFDNSIKVKRDGRVINLKTIFGINQYSFDLNSTPESVVYQLSESKPLMEGILLYFSAYNNMTQAGGVMPFEAAAPQELQKSSNRDYLRKLWKVLSSNVDVYDPTNIKSELSNELGRKLTDKNAKVLFNLIKSQTLLSDKMDEMYQDAMAKQFKDIIKQMGQNNVKIETVDIDKMRKFKKSEKIIKLLEFIEQKKYVGKIKVEDFLSKIKKIKNSDIRLHKIKTKLKNKVKSFGKISSFFNRKTNSKKSTQLTKKEVRNQRVQKVSKALSSVQGGISVVVDINNLCNMSVATDGYEMLKTISNLTATLSSLTSAVPMVSLVFQGASFILDFASEIIGKVTQETFKFSTNESNAKTFLWDGGKTKSRFWGMWKTELSGKKDMKIMTPIKILEGVKDNWIYYNGKKYELTESAKIKNQAIIDFANGDKNAIKTGNNKIKIVYTYDKNPQFNHFSSRLQLSESILNKVITPKDEENYKKYINESKFTVVGGQILFSSAGKTGAVNEELKFANITQTLKSIKPVIKTQLPNLTNGIPNDQVYNKTIKEKFLISKKYFVNGMLKDFNKIDFPSYSEKNFVAPINLNELKDNVSPQRVQKIHKGLTVANPNEFKFTLSKAIEILRKKFLSTVDVQSIYTSFNEVMNINVFSKLKPLNDIHIFKAKGIFGRDNYFKSFMDAFKWLVSRNQYNLKMVIQRGTSTKLIFNNKIFNSTKELLDYVDEIIAKGGEYEK